MSGFLIFPDGRAWAANNSYFDSGIERLAAALPAGAGDLRAWLLDRRSLVRGPGVGSLDLRTVTPDVRDTLLDALERAFPTAESAPPPDVWALDRYELLGHMVRAYRRGEPPGLLNPHMNGLVPFHDRHSGPGWPDPTDDEYDMAELARRFGTDEGGLLRAAEHGLFPAREIGGDWYPSSYVVGRWLDGKRHPAT